MNLTEPVAAQKRRTPAEIRQLVAEFVSSGMPESEFCRSRGLSRSTLYRHLKQQRGKRNAVTPGSPLVRVELTRVQRRGASPSGGLAVVLASGRKIEVAPGFDTSTLEQLVRVLERV